MTVLSEDEIYKVYRRLTPFADNPARMDRVRTLAARGLSAAEIMQEFNAAKRAGHARSKDRSYPRRGLNG